MTTAPVVLTNSFSLRPGDATEYGVVHKVDDSVAAGWTVVTFVGGRVREQPRRELVAVFTPGEDRV